MEYRTLGRTGLKIPALSLGTATFGGGNEFFRQWGTTNAVEATQLIDIALDRGAVLFDSADVYSDGLAEEILGRAITGKRHQLLISTKASFRTGAGANDVGSSRHHLMTACDASLRRLGTDYIDLWYVHGFDGLTAVEETLRTVEDLIRAGKVRQVGCSNFSGWQLMKSLGIADRYGWPRYAAHQAYYSLLAREYEWELMPLASDQQVSTIVWSPLSGGRLSGKLRRDRPAPVGSRTASLQGVEPLPAQEQVFAVVDVLEDIAKQLHRTVAQVALRWLLQRPTVASLVIGARNEAQLRENLDVMEFVISAEQMQRLNEVSMRPPVYPYWHQHALFSERDPASMA